VSAVPWVEAVFDAGLAGLLVAVAWRALSAADVFQSVVLFIAFGLLTSLVWVRLAAPDLALAEAAIGSGVSGALFLAVHGALEGRRRSRESHAGGTSRPDGDRGADDRASAGGGVDDGQG
jgi:uncharacterized MnhB-related membrane protein